jgi:preprotein translocase subunit SecA
VRDFLDQEVEAMGDTYLSSMSPSEWNLEGLSVALRAMGLAEEGTSEDALDEAAQSRETLMEHMRGLVDEALDERQARHGDEVWSQVERFVLLRTIDSLWVEHLTELDDMRRGIGLRGYAQQDPLNEFRKEAFRLYEELGDLIRHQVATTIFRVTVRVEPQTMPLPGPGQPARPGMGVPSGEQHVHPDGTVHDGPAHDGSTPAGAGPGGSWTDAGAAGTAAASALAASGAAGPRGPLAPGQAALRTPATSPDAAVRGLPADPMKSARQAPGDAAVTGSSVRQGYTPSGARIGRNDPCWCGSGQKYKKCHGA